MQATYARNPNWAQTARAFGGAHAVLYQDSPWTGPALASAGEIRAVRLP